MTFNFQEIRNALLETTPICDDAINIIMNMVKSKQFKVGDVLYDNNSNYLSLYLITKVNKKSIRISSSRSYSRIEMENVISINKEDDKVIIKYREEIRRWENRVYISTGEYKEITYISGKNDVIFIKDNILYRKYFTGYTPVKLHDYNIKIQEDKDGNQYINECAYRDSDDFFKPDKYILGKVQINEKLKIELE